MLRRLLDCFELKVSTCKLKQFCQCYKLCNVKLYIKVFDKYDLFNLASYYEVHKETFIEVFGNEALPFEYSLNTIQALNFREIF